jgi:hypothetical protein
MTRLFCPAIAVCRCVVSTGWLLCCQPSRLLTCTCYVKGHFADRWLSASPCGFSLLPIMRRCRMSVWWLLCCQPERLLYWVHTGVIRIHMVSYILFCLLILQVCREHWVAAVLPAWQAATGNCMKAQGASAPWPLPTELQPAYRCAHVSAALFLCCSLSVLSCIGVKVSSYSCVCIHLCTTAVCAFELLAPTAVCASTRAIKAAADV